MSYQRIADAKDHAVGLALMEASDGTLGLMIQADTTRIVIDDLETIMGFIEGTLALFPSLATGKVPDGVKSVTLDDYDNGKGRKRLQKNRKAWGVEDDG